MRLIDALELKRSISASVLSEDGKRIFDIIEEQPTIEERKTGKWIEDAETYYKAVNEKGGGIDENTPYFTEDYIACSECLTMFSVIDNCTEDFDFCPHCGASMMEGEQP